jgi:aerobic-type carbon monoxide dehydrogenase small subunit (CoxS/CutS family)
MADPIQLSVNGVERRVEAAPETSLLTVLRGTLGLTAAHFGCGANQCGACNVLVDGQAIAACDMPLWAVAGKDVTRVSVRPSGRIRCNRLSSPSRPCSAATASPAF